MFDEMNGDGSDIRSPYQKINEWIKTSGSALLTQRSTEIETIFRRIGITFAVYGEGGDPERLIPFDIVPRVFANSEWRKLSRGIVQRSRALNAFLYDVYHRGEIIKKGIIPEELVYRNKAFLPEVIGITPPGKVYSHIVGIDIVRTAENSFYVLEDNCRTPSGVSYMLENREIMLRMFPELFSKIAVEEIDDYPSCLLKTLEEVAPESSTSLPTCVLLTPGPFNSAYYEHSLLADQMGIELVQAYDLFVDDDYVWMKTTHGPKKIDVIYRRVDDSFIDPLVFNPDSMLGIPGLINVYRKGHVSLCSAPGSGIADDKAIYMYVPEMINFYLGEAPILENIPTWYCAKEDDLKYVLENLHELVVKEVHGSGGYGMLVGPHETKENIEKYRKRIEANPSEFIAQPTLALSTTPVFQNNKLASRHVDFRPYCLIGKSARLVPGGLTRVALKEGSLVVNSSQGGGVKDTWILSE